MNNYEYFLNNYNNRAFSMDDFNMLTQFDINPNMNIGINSNTNPNMNMDTNSNTNQISLQLYTPQEGYKKGNLFASLYQPYKNYQPINLTAQNDQQKLFLEFSKMAFAAHELNLYLDNFPNDSSIIRLFNDYREKANMLGQEYQKKYDAITITDSIQNTTPFVWESEKWPWEGGN